MRQRFGRGLEALSKALPWFAPVMAAVICITATVSALWSLTFATFGRDQGIFQYVAWALRNGQRAYLDFHEINGPLPHAWNLVLQRVGGEDEHVFRSIDTAFLLLVYAGSSLTLPRWLGLKLSRPALAAWAFAGFAVLGAQYARYDWWHANQREGFYAVLILASLALQSVAHHTRIARRAMIFFALAGAATSLTWFGKPPCIAFAALQFGVLLFDRSSVVVSLKRAVAASAVGVLASSIVMLAFVYVYGDVSAAIRVLSKVPLLHHTIWNHSLGDCYRAYDNAPRLDWALATSVGFVVAYFLLRLPRRALLAMVLPVGGFIVFAGQGKGFPYHLQLVTLGTSVTQLVILLGLVHRGRERGGAMAVVALAAALGLGIKCRTDARLSPAGRSDWAAAGSTKERRVSPEYFERFPWGDFFTADLHESATWLAEHTRPDDRVQTYGLDPYFLFLAKRHTATPVIYNFELNVDPALEGGSGGKLSAGQRTALLAHRDATEQLLLDLAKRTPPAAFVFLDRAPFANAENGEQDFARHCPDAYQWLDERYAVATRFGKVRIRLRRDLAEK